MKIWTSLWLSACLLAGWPVVAYSQTVAEHSLVTAGFERRRYGQQKRRQGGRRGL